MDVHAPFDVFDVQGKDLRVGDWVLVIAVPLSIRGMPEESKDAFSRAVGNTFQIESFDETGCIELDLWPKVSMDMIWVEPFCVKRFRRYKRLSKAFEQKLEWNSAPRSIRYKLQWEIILKDGVDLDKFGHDLIAFSSGGGFAVWPEQRRIKGSVYAEKTDPSGLTLLDDVKNLVLRSEKVVSAEVSDITETDEI